MTPIIWIAAIALAISAVAIVMWSVSRRSAADLTAVRQEMQASLAAQTQNMAAQINHLMQSVTQQLGQVRQELQTGVANTGNLATQAQRDVAQQLQSSTNMLLQMQQRIGEVYQTSQDLTKATHTLQSVLGGAKTRGSLGEVTLERILEDALPQSAYAIQYRFASTGAVVDAIVRSSDHILSVDSKFPLESYRRLLEAGEDARRDFSQAVRKHADSIAEKYILPDEHTFDYALMFVPSEGVYYELLMTDDSKYGRLDEYCRSKRVFPVSPNTFYACLSAIAISLRGQQIEENARHLFAGLAGLQKQLESFADVYDKLGTHLRHAQQSYEDADSKLTRARNSLEQMSQGALPEATVKALESATGK
ncbi:MAG TPA: DNA recombination protein RmuC [Candidatus Acidoferrales bacterium]|nr:DNA recombination protein RmuC [Candidatus Acidoferrales bacterium]